MKKILYFIQMPPPAHGVSILNEIIYNSDIVNKDFKKILLPINFSKSHKDINRITLNKIFNMFLLNYKLFKALLHEKPDCIYFTLTPTGSGFIRDLMYVITMKLFNTKRIYHLHGIGISKQIKSRRFFKKLYKFVFDQSNIIHLSDGLLEYEIHDNFSELKIKTFVVNNGIAINTFMPNKKNITEKRLLFFSNLFVSKGIFDAIKALAIISTNHPEVYLDVVGASSGVELDQQLKEMINKYDLKDKVVFHGFLTGNDKTDILTKTYLLLHPTYNDAFPLVLLEAMQFGLPIISTKVGAISEIVSDKRTGYLIESGDFNKLAEKAMLLLNDEDKYFEMSSNAKKMFQEKYTLDIFQERMYNVLQKICEDK